ncbi:hypothetical protein SPURM210S_03307 [Streptomyces purpurascens]
MRDEEDQGRSPRTAARRSSTHALPSANWTSSPAAKGARILGAGSGVGRMTHGRLGSGVHGHSGGRAPPRCWSACAGRGPYEPLDRGPGPGPRRSTWCCSRRSSSTRDVKVRRGLLRTCVRHVAEGGSVLWREGADYHMRQRADPAASPCGSAEPVGDGATRCARSTSSRTRGAPDRHTLPGTTADQGSVRGGAGGGGPEGPVSDGGRESGPQRPCGWLTQAPRGCTGGRCPAASSATDMVLTAPCAAPRGRELRELADAATPLGTGIGSRPGPEVSVRRCFGVKSRAGR